MMLNTTWKALCVLSFALISVKEAYSQKDYHHQYQGDYSEQVLQNADSAQSFFHEVKRIPLPIPNADSRDQLKEVSHPGDERINISATDRSTTAYERARKSRLDLQLWELFALAHRARPPTTNSTDLQKIPLGINKSEPPSSHLQTTDLFAKGSPRSEASNVTSPKAFPSETLINTETPLTLSTLSSELESQQTTLDSQPNTSEVSEPQIPLGLLGSYSTTEEEPAESSTADTTAINQISQSNDLTNFTSGSMQPPNTDSSDNPVDSVSQVATDLTVLPTEATTHHILTNDESLDISPSFETVGPSTEFSFDAEVEITTPGNENGIAVLLSMPESATSITTNDPEINSQSESTQSVDPFNNQSPSSSAASPLFSEVTTDSLSIGSTNNAFEYEGTTSSTQDGWQSATTNGENLSIIIQTDEPPMSTDAFPIQNTLNATELSNSFESSHRPTTLAPAIITAAENIPQSTETSLFPTTAAPETSEITSENSQSESMTEASADSVTSVNLQNTSPVDFSVTALFENQDTANLNQESATTSGESFSGTTINMAESGFSTEPEQFLTQTSPVNQTVTYITETTEPTAFEQIIQATLPASIVPPIETANIELGVTPTISVNTESSPSFINSENPFQINEVADLVTEILGSDIATNSEMEAEVSSQSSLNNVDVENALDIGITVQNPLQSTENPTIVTLVYLNDTLQSETTSISAQVTVDDSKTETTTMYTENIEAGANAQSTEHPTLTTLNQQIASGMPETSSILETTVGGLEQETTPMYAENTESSLSSNLNVTHVEDDLQSVTTDAQTQSTDHPTLTTLNQGIDTELPGTLPVSASTTIFGAPEQETTPSYTGNTESSLPSNLNETVQEEVLPIAGTTDQNPLPQPTENPSLTTLNHQSDILLIQTSPIPESTTLLSIPEQETTQGLTMVTDLGQLSNLNETSLEDNLQTDISAQNLNHSTEYPTLTTLFQHIDIILPETSSMSASATTIFDEPLQETTTSYTLETEPDLPSYVNQTDQEEVFPPTTTIQSLVPQPTEYPNLITSTVQTNTTLQETSSISLSTTTVNDLEQETIPPDTYNTESNFPMNLNETDLQQISEIGTIQSLSQYTENPISTTVNDKYDTVVPDTSPVSVSTTTVGTLEPDMNSNVIVTTEFHVSSATFDSLVPTTENLDLTTSNYHIDALLPETSSTLTLTTVSAVPELDTTSMGNAATTESNLPSQLIDNDQESNLSIGTTGNSLLQSTENTDMTTSGYQVDTFSQETSSTPGLTTIMTTGLLETTETNSETEIELTNTATEALTSSTSMQNPITSATEPYDDGSSDSSSTPGEMPAMNTPGAEESGITTGLEESSTTISTPNQIANQTEIHTVGLTEPSNSLQSTTILPDDIAPLTESPFTENETTPSYVVITESHASLTPNENDVEIATANSSYATVPDTQNQYSTTENSPNENFGQNETGFTSFSNQTETFTMEPEPTISPPKTTILPDDILPLTESPFTENETTPSYVVITESHASHTTNENDVEMATANSSYATVPDSQNQYSTTENSPNEDFGQNETGFTSFSNQTETFTVEPEPTISPPKTTILPDDIAPLTENPFMENETTPSYVVITESHASYTTNENDVEIATANSSSATVPDSQNQYSTTENSLDFGQNETGFTSFSNQTETFTMEPEPTISPQTTTVFPEDISLLPESPFPETTSSYVVTTESHASPTAAENEVEIVTANPSHATAPDNQSQYSTTEYFPDETNGQNETNLTFFSTDVTSNAESSTESEIPEFTTVGLLTSSNSTLDVDDPFQEITEDYESMIESSTTNSIESTESIDIDSLVTDPPQWNSQGPNAVPDGIPTINSPLLVSGLTPGLTETLGIGQNVLVAGIIAGGILQIATPSSPTVDNGIPALMGVEPDTSSLTVASNNVYQPETVTSPPTPAPVQNVGFFGQLRLALRQLFVQYGIFGFFFLAPLVFLSQIFSSATGRSFAYNRDHLANLLLDLSDGMIDEPVFLLKSLAQAFPEQFEPPQSPDTAYLNDFLFNLFPEQTHHIVFAKGLKLPVLLSLAFPDKMGNLSDEDWQTVNTLQTVPDNPPMNLGHILADMASDVASYAVKQERQLRSFIAMLESEIFD